MYNFCKVGLELRLVGNKGFEMLSRNTQKMLGPHDITIKTFFKLVDNVLCG